MSKSAIGYIFSFIILVLLQVSVFNRIALFGYATPFLFLYFILKLPTTLSANWTMTLSFLMGLVIDIFSNTPGMYALASVSVAFVRRTFIALVLQRGNEEVSLVPSFRSFGSAGDCRRRLGRDMGLRRPDRPPKVASADRHGRRRRRARRPQLALHRAGRRLRRPHRPAQRQTALALRLRTGTGAGAPDARGRETGIRGVGQAPLLPRRRDGQMPLEMEQRPPRRVPLPGACRAPHRRRQGLHRGARPGRDLPRPGYRTAAMARQQP